MSVIIHPSAIVDKNAQLGEGVEIGPYASIGPDVKIGARTVVQQGAIVSGHTTIGEECQIFPYACIGMKTQDLKYKDGSVSYVEIGNRTVIREFATVHLGTADGEKTILGDDVLFMAYCHAAHGVVLGNHVICSNSVQLAGDVHLSDWAIVGGCTGAHQFCSVGRHAMVGGMCKIRQDFPPFMLGTLYFLRTSYVNLNKHLKVCLLSNNSQFLFFLRQIVNRQMLNYDLQFHLLVRNYGHLLQKYHSNSYNLLL